MKPASHKTVQLLSERDAAYLAGLIDGEGTITLSRRSRLNPRGLYVTISNTEYCLLRHVRGLVGAGKITNKRISLPHHTPSFTYHIANRQALELLRQIQPFLQSHKSRRAALVLKEYIRLTPRNGRYNPVLLQERDAFIDQFFSITAGSLNGQEEIR